MHHPVKMLFYIFILSLSSLLYSCSSDEASGPSINDIPVYPNSKKGESMQHSMFGMIGGALQQYSTTDGFKRVLGFYESELALYNPDVMTHHLEHGRQSAITIEKDDGALTVAIQEYKDEGQVMITFMEVSK